MGTDDISLTVTDFNDADNTMKVDRTPDMKFNMSVIFGGARPFNRDGGNGGTIILGRDEVQ